MAGQVVVYRGRVWSVVKEHDGMITIRRRGVRVRRLIFTKFFLYLPCRQEVTVKRSAVTNVVPIR